MKKFLFILISLILITSAVPTFAMSSRLNDSADLLTSSEETEILDLLDNVSTETSFDLVIVTTNDTEGKSVRDYADDYYDYNGYGESGILFLVDMGNREWWISTSGEAINKFSDSTLDYIGEEASWYLGNGDYVNAFKTFISLSEEYIYMDGDAEEPYNPISTLIVSLIAGFIIALIYVSVLKSKLTTVGAQQNAANYTVNNSLQIAATSDNFLYRRVSRAPRPKSNTTTTHSSSSGRSHGGRGGRF
ncbi:MAG: TPM domain-containing protein [Clostridia bacterium]|nr:TPM domain-containing protein [Clostridia bacterium]